MRKTVAINFFGAPGTGKTTMVASTFAEMKARKISCEMVLEFAKEALYENRTKVFQNEIYLFAKKHHKMKVLVGQVDYILTDSPLLMTHFYNEKYGGDNYPGLNELALGQHRQFENINIFLKRVVPYEEDGRRESEEEADKIQKEIFEYSKNIEGRNIIIDADVKNVERLVDTILCTNI